MSVLIAEAYAEIGWKDSKFVAGMAKATAAFASFTSNMKAASSSSNAAFTAGTATLQAYASQVAKTRQNVVQLASSLRNAAIQARALNTALGGGSASAMAANTRAAGAYIASLVRAGGAAFGSIFRGLGIGFGFALSSGLRGAGSFVSQPIRALGSGVASVLRGVGSMASQTIRALAAPIAAITRPLASMVGSVSRLMGGGLGLGALGGILGGIGAGFSLKYTVDSAADIEQQMAKLKRAADIDDEAFNRLGVDLKRFAGYADGIKLDSVFEIATIGAKLGIAGDQLNLFTRDIAKLRVAIDENDLPTQEMTEGIASMLSVFHRGTDEAIRFGSALNRLDLMSTASARDILDVSRRMSGTATLLGMSPQKTLALATALRQARVPVETAGTAMSQIMGRMASKRDSGHFAQLAGVKPLDWLKLVGNDPLEAIKKLEQGLQKLDRIKAIRKLDELHLDGQRVRGTLLQLGTVIQDLDKYVAESEKEWDGMNSVLKSNEIMGATMQAQWTKLANNFKLTASSLGESLLPALKELANGLVRLMHDIRESIENNKETFTAWGKWLGNILGNVGALWQAWPMYVKYASLIVEEKLKQLQEIFRRVGVSLWENLKWGFSSAFTFLKNMMVDLASYLGELGQNLGAAMGAHIHNAMVVSLTATLPAVIATKLGLTMKKVPQIAPNLRQPAVGPPNLDRPFANLGRDIPAAPGLPDVMKDLPNMGVAIAKQGQAIALANKAQIWLLDRKIQADARKDAQARNAADAARNQGIRPAANRFNAINEAVFPNQPGLAINPGAPRRRRPNAPNIARLRPAGAFVGPPNLGAGPPMSQKRKAELARIKAAREAAREAEKRRRQDAINMRNVRRKGLVGPPLLQAPGGNMQQPDKEKDIGDIVGAMGEVKTVNDQMLAKLGSIDQGISALLMMS